MTGLAVSLLLPASLTVSPSVSLSQYQAILPASLLHADSRDHHNLRWEGRRCHYLPFFMWTGGPFPHYLCYSLSAGSFLNFVSTLNLDFVRSRREKCEENVSALAFLSFVMNSKHVTIGTVISWLQCGWLDVQIPLTYWHHTYSVHIVCIVCVVHTVLYKYTTKCLASKLVDWF